MTESNVCRVCGLYLDEPPWGEDGNTPSYLICPCCGVEFGNEDYTVGATRAYRARWLDSGAKWFRPRDKPLDWNLEHQLRQVPQDYL